MSKPPTHPLTEYEMDAIRNGCKWIRLKGISLSVPTFSLCPPPASFHSENSFDHCIQIQKSFIDENSENKNWKMGN